jgi:3-oxoacyl-[acyl-carrier protein] reductase
MPVSCKRILVTGGSRGLGLAMCQRLIADGCQIVTASRTLSPELGSLIDSRPGQIEHHIIDFSDPNAATKLSKAVRLIDGIDGFVSNAAIGTDGLLTLTSEAAITTCVQVNLTAPILLAREVIKGMLANGGSIVFISSIAARTGLSGLAAYSATKGGLISFSRALAREYGERGIRSNVVLPGYFETEMSRGIAPDNRERIVRRTALKRVGEPEDVVGVVRFLLSDEAMYITGTEIVVDGGMTV